jgi:hypothetical protein
MHRKPEEGFTTSLQTQPEVLIAFTAKEAIGHACPLLAA